MHRSSKMEKSHNVKCERRQKTKSNKTFKWVLVQRPSHRRCAYVIRRFAYLVLDKSFICSPTPTCSCILHFSANLCEILVLGIFSLSLLHSLEPSCCRWLFAGKECPRWCIIYNTLLFWLRLLLLFFFIALRYITLARVPGMYNPFSQNTIMCQLNAMIQSYGSRNTQAVATSEFAAMKKNFTLYENGFSWANCRIYLYVDVVHCHCVHLPICRVTSVRCALRIFAFCVSLRVVTRTRFA